MTFKRGHAALGATIFIAALIIPSIILQVKDFVNSPNRGLGALMLLCFLYVVTLAYLLFVCISYERTVEMSAEGCTVRFLWYEKFYRWDEMQVRRLADYSECRWGKALCVRYSEGAEFSPKRVRRRESQPPQFYCQSHPLTYIYVNFRNKAAEEFPRLEHVCEADKEVFLAKLSEWGVVLEEAPK